MAHKKPYNYRVLYITQAMNHGLYHEMRKQQASLKAIEEANKQRGEKAASQAASLENPLESIR